MDKDSSASTSIVDSGVQTPKRPRPTPEKNTKKAIVETMLHEIGKFSGQVLCIKA